MNQTDSNEEYKKAATSAYSYANSSQIVWLSFIIIGIWRVPQKLLIARKSNDPDTLKIVDETIKVYKKILLSWVFVFILFFTFFNVILGVIASLFFCYLFYFYNKKYFWLYNLKSTIIIIALSLLLSIFLKSVAIIS